MRAVSSLSTKVTKVHVTLLGLLDFIDYIFNVVMFFSSNGLKMDFKKKYYLKGN